MADTPNSNSISGESQTTSPPSELPQSRPTLREVAEAAWDEHEGGDSSDSTAEPASPADRGDGRDARGRFTPKEPARTGEAEETPPSPDRTAEAQDRPDSAPAGTSNQVPEHWSAEFKADFAKLPPEGQNILLKRYGEMEADYTRKSQANAGAVQAVQALAPVFQDPVIAESMRQSNITAMQAIYDWARLHKGAVSDDPRQRAQVLMEIAERMGFDPARIFAPSRPPVQLTAEQQADPTVRYFAELQGKANSDLQALRAELNQFKAQESSRLEQEALQVTRSSVDAYADEVGADGRPVRPYFDRVINRIIEALYADPSRDMGEVYEQACWADPDVRKELLQAEQNRIAQQKSNQRAQLAVRGNVRGVTSPVAKPAPAKQGKGSLRDMLEASADEVGF